MSYDELMKKIRAQREARVIAEKNNQVPEKRTKAKGKDRVKKLLEGLSPEEKRKLLEQFGGE